MTDITLPIKGGWIMVTRRLPTRIQPKLFGIYFAKPEKVFERYSSMLGRGNQITTEQERTLLWRQRCGANLNEDEEGALARIGRRGHLRFHDDEELALRPDIIVRELELEMRVRIVTPEGEVCLEAHEYSILDDVTPFVELIGDGMIMRELGGIKNAKKFQEQLFYVMSRGIGRIAAYQMLLGQIDRPNVFWLEPEPAVAAYFDRQAS